MYTQLFNLIASIQTVSDALREALPSLLTRENLPKKTLLLREGKVCDHVYFIEKGLVRAFYHTDGQDTTDWFMQEGDLIISVYSFFLQLPSFENIELLEDCTLVSIPYQDLQWLYQQYPEFNFVGRVLTERYYVRGEARAIALRRQTALERYESLLETNPQLLHRAHLKHIASFLGMAPETLSRLRSRTK